MKGSAMDNGNNFQKVAFLDTNVIHYVGLYLDHAKKANLFPWGGTARDTEDAVTVARDALGQVMERNLAESLQKGLKILAMVESDSLSVQYATVSELELMTGRAKGKAIHGAAVEGLPHRMWSKFSEKEITRRVTIPQLRAIRSNVANIIRMIQRAGISVARGPGRVEEVFELAMEINALVYVDGMDSIIYASALLSQADVLFSGDAYLRRTVNLIANPEGRSRYREARKLLRRAVGRIILTDADRVVLPIAPKPRFPTTKSGQQAKGPPPVSGSGAS